MIDAIIIKFAIYTFIYESIKEKRIERVYSIYSLKVCNRFTVNINNNLLIRNNSTKELDYKIVLNSVY